MSDNKWSMNFKFGDENKEWITELFDGRDKKQYPNKVDLATYSFRKEYARMMSDSIIPDVVLTSDQIEHNERLISLCPRMLLKIIDTIPTCTQKIKLEPLIYEKGFPNVGKVMRYEDILDKCESCIQRFTEKARLEEALKGFMREDTSLYSCNHPDILSDAFTAFKEAKYPCPKQSLKEVRIDRTCIKTNCNYLLIQMLKLPKVEIVVDKSSL